MNRESPFGAFLLGLLLAIGLAVAGYFVSLTQYNARVAINTAEAKGLAERRVRADRANWTVRFQVSGSSRDQVPRLYEQAEAQQQQIVALLREGGLEEGEISADVLDYGYQEFRGENQQLVDQRHTISGGVSVETDEVDRVSEIRASLNRLIAQGIELSNQPPVYRFTKLNEIKPDMLREATRNARIAANEFAENAGVQVGGIRDARQGNFFIRDAGEEYGDTVKIEKDVRVVTTITFYLTE